ncbi:glycosyltransferase family 4 protein [Ferroplasma sp.]|uniref:glycosyltransferase family 4 protein n=1 Tax=Ferroplasma sp. TaxID=2591003 RepID=UPI002638B609|nr:glycosyltransferase family 4 protein [Ferroplasma sp.]
MKVLLIDEFSRIGGGQILSKLLLDYFNKNYGQTYIAVDREHTYIEYENIIKTPYYFRENMKLPFLYYYVARTKKFLKQHIQNQFDLVFNNHPNMFLYKADINALHGFSFLDQIIDEYGNIKNKIIFNFIKKSGMYNIYNNANFLVNSNYTLQISRKLFPLLNIKPNLMRLIYIPVEYVENIDLSIKDKNLVISIGRIDMRKNYEVLLRIAEKLKNYRFIIAGALNRGDEEYYRNLIKNKPDNVEIKANINEYEKIELLKKASIYIHLNRRENYGISILEAMSYGSVPVVPESGGPWEDIIEYGKYGYGFNSVDEAVEQITNIDFNIEKTIIDSMDRFSFKNFYHNMDNFVEEVQNS